MQKNCELIAAITHFF